MDFRFQPGANLPNGTQPVELCIPDAELATGDPSKIFELLDCEAKERSEIHLTAVADNVRRKNPTAGEKEITIELVRYRQTLPEWTVILGGVELGVIVGVASKMLRDTAQEALKRPDALSEAIIDDNDDKDMEIEIGRDEAGEGDRFGD
jgi:hypothetical protein